MSRDSTPGTSNLHLAIYKANMFFINIKGDTIDTLRSFKTFTKSVKNKVNSLVGNMTGGSILWNFDKYHALFYHHQIVWGFVTELRPHTSCHCLMMS